MFKADFLQSFAIGFAAMALVMAIPFAPQFLGAL
jgi:hypothetical protein